MVEGDEVVDGLLEERVPLLGEHQVVGDTDGDGFWENDGVLEEGIHGSQAADIQVDVDTAIVVQHKVANGVGTLDRVLVMFKRIEEPWVMGSNEFARGGVCPELVFAAGGENGRRDRETEARTSRASCRDMPARWASSVGATRRSSTSGG